MGLRVPISWLNDYVASSDPEALAEIQQQMAALQQEMRQIMDRGDKG